MDAPLYAPAQQAFETQKTQDIQHVRTIYRDIFSQLAPEGLNTGLHRTCAILRNRAKQWGFPFASSICRYSIYSFGHKPPTNDIDQLITLSYIDLLRHLFSFVRVGVLAATFFSAPTIYLFIPTAIGITASISYLGNQTFLIPKKLDSIPVLGSVVKQIKKLNTKLLDFLETPAGKITFAVTKIFFELSLLFFFFSTGHIVKKILQLPALLSELYLLKEAFFSGYRSISSDRPINNRYRNYRNYPPYTRFQPTIVEKRRELETILSRYPSTASNQQDFNTQNPLFFPWKMDECESRLFRIEQVQHIVDTILNNPMSHTSSVLGNDSSIQSHYLPLSDNTIHSDNALNNANIICRQCNNGVEERNIRLDTTIAQEIRDDLITRIQNASQVENDS